MPTPSFKSVRDKVRYYEAIFSPQKQEKKIGVPAVMSPRKEPQQIQDKENCLNILNVPIVTPSKQTAMKKLKVKEKIHKRRKPVEREDEPLFNVLYNEKQVECVKEKEEHREKKIEMLEKKVLRVRRQHRDSLRQGDVEKADVLLKKLFHVEKQLNQAKTPREMAKEEEMAAPRIIEEPTESTELTPQSEEEISEIDVVSSFDMLGGIAEAMALEYCQDQESTWRTFSSYSVCDYTNHSELFIESEETMNRSSSDDSKMEENPKLTTEEKNRSIFERDENMDLERIYLSEQRLEDTKIELAAFRANLYSTLHQLAANEHQMRLFERELSLQRSENLKLEKQLETKKIELAIMTRTALEQEIAALRQETSNRKERVQQLRKQIRNAIAALPQQLQYELNDQYLTIEDPFIECSVRLLADENTSLGKIATVSRRLSSLSSAKKVVPSTKKRRKNVAISNVFSPKFLANKISRKKPKYVNENKI